MCFGNQTQKVFFLWQFEDFKSGGKYWQVFFRPAMSGVDTLESTRVSTPISRRVSTPFPKIYLTNISGMVSPSNRTSGFMRTLLWPLKIPIVDALKLPAACATWLVLYENSSRDERTRHPQSASHQRWRDCGHHMDRRHDRRAASDAAVGCRSHAQQPLADCAL